jgi:hypothetical protein
LVSEEKMFDLSVHYADYDDKSSEELASSEEFTTKRGGIPTRLTTILEEREVDYFKSLLQSEEEDDATYSITSDSSTVMDETTASTAGSVLYLCGAHLFRPWVFLSYGLFFI